MGRLKVLAGLRSTSSCRVNEVYSLVDDADCLPKKGDGSDSLTADEVEWELALL